MKKSKGIVVLLLTLILTVFFCFTAAVGIGPTGTGAAKHINTGLDLAGGVSITYQAKESNPTSEEMSDTIYKLQKRVEQYSTEAQVYQEGSDRITVEIPGVTDADTILNDLGKPGSLYFITKEDADGKSDSRANPSGSRDDDSLGYYSRSQPGRCLVSSGCCAQFYLEPAFWQTRV